MGVTFNPVPIPWTDVESCGSFPLPSHIRLAFRGRQPLCGTGVLSVMEITSRPPIVKPLMAAWKNKTADDMLLSTHWKAEKEKSSGENSLVLCPKINLFQWFYFVIILKISNLYQETQFRHVCSSPFISVTMNNFPTLVERSPKYSFYCASTVILS